MIKVGKVYVDKAVLFLGFPWILICLLAFIFAPDVATFIGWAAPALVIFTFRDVFFRRANDE
jgi:hypothetical protein